MNKIKFTATALATGLAISIGSTHAAKAEVTGNDVMDMCANYDYGEQGPNVHLCLGYIWGMWAGVDHMAAISMHNLKNTGISTEDFHEEAIGICMPEGISNFQLADIYIRFLREAPESRHHLASVLLHAAYQTAFPCGKGDPA